MSARLECEVLVVGGGLAGAMAALAARRSGARVALARRAPGATAVSSGAISSGTDPTELPGASLGARAGVADSARRLAALRPRHPYAVAGERLERLEEALAFAAGELSPVLAPFTGRHRWLPTPYGSFQAAALCQRSMVAADLGEARGRLAVVALRGHMAWDAGMVASAVERAAPLGGPRAEVARLDFPMWEEAALWRPHELAGFLERPGAAEDLGAMLRRSLPSGASAAVFPPVLGLSPGADVASRVAAAAGLPVAETLSDVPSVPGLRLQAALEARLRSAGVEILAGDLREGKGPGAPAACAGREVLAPSWVLASGRFVGGGIVRRGALAEPLLGIPVTAAEAFGDWGAHLARRPAASLTYREGRAPQPLLSAGVACDALFRPLDAHGAVIHERLFAAGAVLGGHDQAADGSGLGLAVFTGYLAGQAAAAGGSLAPAPAASGRPAGMLAPGGGGAGA
ncbi:MAG TPA: FAD-binding protein [Anaeromyxobacteraceae bacterium]|nr:FAD-binding protein [Anaeromyxobacteraceae bacterium]